MNIDREPGSTIRLPVLPATRRQALQRAAAAGAAALLGAAGCRMARAQATPSAATTAGTEERAEPTRYALSGGNVEIVYEPASAPGGARIDYRDADVAVSVAGDDVEEGTLQPLGRYASAYLNAVPDGYVRYLTLLIPIVNPTDDRAEVPFETLAIVTTHLTTIAGPDLIEGAVHTYEAVTLSGVAEFAPA